MSTSGIKQRDQQTAKNIVDVMRNANLLKKASVHSQRIEPLMVVVIAEETMDTPIVLKAYRVLSRLVLISGGDST